tara:strand:- start:1579 stop:2100 length:522 start_codon:yes stop_codon:yes gene_type:complete
MKINEKLATIQAELKVAKKRRNNFGNYNFRNAEDILEALKPFIIKYKVNFTIDEGELTEVAGIPIFTTTATITDNESSNFIHKTAIVGVDIKQKGMATPQQFGSASSYGKKYALGNLLLIDDTQDNDNPLMNEEQIEKAKDYIAKSSDKKKALSIIKAKYNVDDKIEKVITTL